MADTTARMLRLLSLMQARRHWTGAGLADRLQVSERTLRRDVDRLRDLGYPVVATRGVGGGYALEAGAAIPPLLLDDDEVVAIAVGLRTAAGGSVTGIEETSVRALAKLEQVLPTRLRHRVNAVQTSVVPLLHASGPTIDPTVLATIALACRDHERLGFGYRDRDGAESRRIVEPNQLVAAGRRWYLVAWDLGREDWRTFRVDRLERPAATGGRFTPRELPADDAADFVERSMASLVARHRAVVTLHAARDVVADRLHPGHGELEPLGEDRCRFTVEADSLPWLAFSIAMLDVDFEIEEPRELADHVRTLADRFARATPT